MRARKKRDLVQAGEERGAPGKVPGEDINSHWLDIKGGREGSRQENSMNTSMDTRENMSMHQMDHSHHAAKTKV